MSIGLDVGHGFMVYIYPQTQEIVNIKYVQILHVNHTSIKCFFLTY